DRVIVIAAGRVVAEGPPDSIGGRADADAQIRFQTQSGASLGTLPVEAEINSDGLVVVTTSTPTATLHALTTWALANGGELSQLSVARPSLDDIYVALTADNGETPTWER